MECHPRLLGLLVSNSPFLFPLPGNQGGMNSSYYGGGSRGSMGMNGLNSGMSMGAGWGM